MMVSLRRRGDWTQGPRVHASVVRGFVGSRAVGSGQYWVVVVVQGCCIGLGVVVVASGERGAW